MKANKSEPKPKPFPMILLVGAGGVGSYLLPTLLRTIRDHADQAKSPHVVVFDGDLLEPRNMERQLFDEADIGKNKATALVEKYLGYYPNLHAEPQFFSGGEQIDFGALIISCVDNHPGRMRVLHACDTFNCSCILCGNGYTDAEAMFYKPDWKDTALDPRVYYPDIVHGEEGDPLAPEGCTGQAQAAAPQLAVANFMAAAYALHLLWFWTQEAGKLDGDGQDFSCVRHINNFNRIQTKVRKDHALCSNHQA